jgi:UDP-2,4-diacetamido-2,4,6-trideoxy-beta-L-altropyranose hydrolase
VKVLFRVEGNHAIGLGHIMRCLALAQSMVAQRHEVIFAISERSLPLCQSRVVVLGKVLILPTSCGDSEVQWLTKQCEKLAVDWLVLDGYEFQQDYRFALRSAVFKLAVFDDTNDTGALHADLVINGAPNAELINYQQTAANAVLAVGEYYRILRPEFLQLAEKSWSGRDCMTLMFGGSDPLNLTMSLLNLLAKSPLSMPIVVITGAAYGHLANLEKWLTTSTLAIQHLHDCQHMAEILSKTRLAVSAAGGAQFELLACATPAILLVTAKNQLFASQQAAQQGWCEVINLEQTSITALAEQCINLWQQPQKLQNMHQQALTLTTHDGAKHIVELMAQDLVSDK